MRQDEAYYLGQAGQRAVAIERLRGIAADCAGVLGPDDPLTLLSRHNAAYFLVTTGRHVQAVEELRDVHSAMVRCHGADDEATLRCQQTLAGALRSAGERPRGSNSSAMSWPGWVGLGAVRWMC